MLYITDDITEEEEEVDEEAASLDDDLLSEVVGEDEVLDDEVEGFGLLEETDDKEEEKEEEEDLDADASLEDDAEDVEYDSFDDVDWVGAVAVGNKFRCRRDEANCRANGRRPADVRVSDAGDNPRGRHLLAAGRIAVGTIADDRVSRI